MRPGQTVTASWTSRPTGWQDRSTEHAERWTWTKPQGITWHPCRPDDPGTPIQAQPDPGDTWDEDDGILD